MAKKKLGIWSPYDQPAPQSTGYTNSYYNQNFAYGEGMKIAGQGKAKGGGLGGGKGKGGGGGNPAAGPPPVPGAGGAPANQFATPIATVGGGKIGGTTNEAALAKIQENKPGYLTDLFGIGGMEGLYGQTTAGFSGYLAEQAGLMTGAYDRALMESNDVGTGKQGGSKKAKQRQPDDMNFVSFMRNLGYDPNDPARIQQQLNSMRANYATLTPEARGVPQRSFGTGWGVF